jgi:hypothetical protein
VAIVHGRDDDVIPWLEAEKLRAALPEGHRARLLLTGLYDHTGSKTPGLRTLFAEARTMLGVIGALLDAPLGLL